MLLLNKCDLGVHPEWREFVGVRFSCKERTGLEDLIRVIWDRVMGERLMGEKIKLADVRVAINARHQACLQSAKQLLMAGARS